MSHNHGRPDRPLSANFPRGEGESWRSELLSLVTVLSATCIIALTNHEPSWACD